MKRKFNLLCVCGALAATLIAGTVCAACGSSVEFDILAPAADAENVSTTPEISWTAAESADLYHVEIATDGAFEDVIREGTTEGLSYTVGNALAHATQYHLRVTALREEEMRTLSVASAVSSFKTVAEHNTDAPDYTQTRTVFDFESYADSAALQVDFSRHVDGNDVDVALVNTGVEGSKAMQIGYKAGNKGWSGVLCKLPSEKKVWSGAKGIRMYVKGDGLGVNIEVRIGKRGYQSWAATFSVNNPTGQYVSIPFSAFDDIGGGDGIWDLAGITRFWLFFTGGSDSTVIIDNITIGSDAAHTTDNRSEIEKSFAAPAGVYENFDDRTNEDIADMFDPITGTTNTIDDSPFSTGKALANTPGAAWSPIRLKLPNYDFTGLGSVFFKASAGTYTIQLETKDDVFELDNIVISRDGDEVGANIADLVSRNHTAGPRLVSYLVIGVHKGANTPATVYIDDITFSEDEFIPKDYTPHVGAFDDFESYADTAALEKIWMGDPGASHSVVTLETENPLSGSKSLKVTSTTTWTAVTYAYPNVDFSAVASIRFKASAGTYIVKFLTETGKSIGSAKNAAVTTDGDETGVNLSDYDFKGERVKQLLIGINGNSMILDDFVYSDEEIGGGTTVGDTVGLIEDFEGMAADTISSFATVSGATLALEESNGNKSAKFTAGGVFNFEVASSYLTSKDLTKTIGFELVFKPHASGGNPSIVIQIGSYQNVYELTRNIYGAAQTNITKLVVLYDSMSLADGSSGDLNKANINYMRIFVNQYATDFTLIIDDIKFLTAETYTPDTVMIDDFSGYQDDAAVQAKWNAQNVTLDNGAMKMTTASGWNGTQWNFTTGEFGSDADYQNCYAIAFDVTTSVDIQVHVKLQRWSNAKEAIISVKGGQTPTHLVVYIPQFEGPDWSDMIFQYLTIGVTYYGETDVIFDNVAFLRG